MRPCKSFTGFNWKIAASLGFAFILLFPSASNLLHANAQTDLLNEPLLPSSRTITRALSFPVLTFAGEVISETKVSISWKPDGTTEVTDDRGSKYVMSIPASQGAFSLWYNSTVVDQRVIGDNSHYDVYWTVVAADKGNGERFKFTIVGNAVNTTTISFNLNSDDDHRVLGNSFSVLSPARMNDNYAPDPSLNWNAPSRGIEYENSMEEPSNTVFMSDAQIPERLGLDWSDAVSEGHDIFFDPIESSLKVNVTGNFIVDPAVVGTTSQNISPGTGTGFEGETRIINTGERINVFYYDGSNIVYKTSDDKGKTWSTGSTSTGSGTLTSDSERWSVVLALNNITQYVVVLYWAANGSNTNYYSLRGAINGTQISWASPILIGYTVSDSTNCGAGGSCAAVSVALDDNGTIFAAYTWLTTSSSNYYYHILKSADAGLTWTATTSQVSTSSTYKPTMALTLLNSSQVLFTFSRYSANTLYYRVYDGSGWGSQQTLSSVGLVTNTHKQLSAISDSSQNAYLAYTNTTSGSGGILKIAKFANNGTFQTVETADSSLRHYLPNMMYSLNGGLNVYTIANNKVYDTRYINGAWDTPFLPFGQTFTSPNQLTALNLFNGENSAIWREGSASPYNLVFAGLWQGTVDVQDTQISPSSTDYFEGERRLVRSGNGTLFAFYYDGSNINYKSSIDDGNTWSGSPISTNTGSIASDSHRWSLTHFIYSSGERVSLLYYKVSGSNTTFYAKTFAVSGVTLNVVSTDSLFSVANDSSCNPTGVCASATGISDGNGNVFAAFAFKTGGTWYLKVRKSADGGDNWVSSLGDTLIQNTSNHPPLTIARLGAGKLLLAWAKYESTWIFYRTYDGSNWSSGQSVNSTGWSANTIKQISSGTNSSGFGFVSYVAGGISGSLKVAVFSPTGTFISLMTVDSSLSHSLPSVSVSSDDRVHFYSIANSTVFVTRLVNSSAAVPERPLSQSYSSIDQLNSAMNSSFLMLKDSSSSPDTIYSAVDFGGLEDYAGGPNISGEIGGSAVSVSPYRYLGLYDDRAKLAIYKARIICNFAGTNPSVIASTNYLTCTGSVQNPTSVSKEDWAYQIYATVLNTGTIKVGADVWRVCEDFPLEFNKCKDNFPEGAYQLKFRKSPVTIPASMSSDIALYMEWNSAGTLVTWYYQVGSAPRVAYASLYKVSQQNPAFNTGKFTHLNVGVTAYYFQAAIGSKTPITNTNWAVMIKKPSYAIYPSGFYIYSPTARTIRGDQSFFDATFKWGGANYLYAKATQYDCAGSFPAYQVKFSYVAGYSQSSHVKLWAC